MSSETILFYVPHKKKLDYWHDLVRKYCYLVPGFMGIIMFNKEFILCFKTANNTQMDSCRLRTAHNVSQALSCKDCVRQYLDISLMWDILQDDGLHGEDVGKLHLRDVECTHNMGPA